jgi:NADH:ubiquinone oxidoreductase subunit 6 (subunit J)
MLYVLLIIALLSCAVFAVRARHLLSSALWLAGVSASAAILLYQIGAVLIAVIELSLSVGLITILLVFAISMAGADSPDLPVSRWFDLPVVLLMLLLIIGLTLPILVTPTDTPESSFATIFWNLRQADVLAQMALIFTGVLGVLGILVETRSKDSEQVEAISKPEPDEIPAEDFEPEMEQV